jgi:hypothetical protein
VTSSAALQKRQLKLRARPADTAVELVRDVAVETMAFLCVPFFAAALNAAARTLDRNALNRRTLALQRWTISPADGGCVLRHRTADNYPSILAFSLPPDNGARQPHAVKECNS